MCLKCAIVIQDLCSNLFILFLQVKKKKVSHLIYIPRICHLCPLDHIIIANLICQRFTYHSPSLWWDSRFQQVRLLAYFLLRWKLLIALAKGSRQKRKVERWKGWTHCITMQDDDCTSEFALCGKCSGRHAFCMMLHANIVKGLKQPWIATDPFNFHMGFDVKWRGGWWCRGVTQSQYVSPPLNAVLWNIPLICCPNVLLSEALRSLFM